MDNSPRYIKWNGRIYAKTGEIHDLAYCYLSVEKDKCPNCNHSLGKHQFVSIPTSPNHKQCVSEVTFDDFSNLIGSIEKSNQEELKINSDEITVKDSAFLWWIHERMTEVYKENENVDFLYKLRKIIIKLENIEKLKL